MTPLFYWGMMSPVGPTVFILGGFFWPIITLNVGMLLMIRDSLNGRLPVIAIMVPAIYFVTYYAWLAFDKIHAGALAREIISQNRSVHFPNVPDATRSVLREQLIDPYGKTLEQFCAEYRNNTTIHVLQHPYDRYAKAMREIQKTMRVSENSRREIGRYSDTELLSLKLTDGENQTRELRGAVVLTRPLMPVPPFERLVYTPVGGKTGEASWNVGLGTTNFKANDATFLIWQALAVATNCPPASPR